MKLTWQKSYDFGIPEIDEGHHRIIDAVNEIYELIDKNLYDRALGKVIHMIAVERKHAAVETELLKRYGYSGIGEHTQYHKQIHRQMTHLMEALGEGDQPSARQCYEGLCENIMDDILRGDLPFKSLLQHNILGV